jgi:hypothetical protein
MLEMMDELYVTGGSAHREHCMIVGYYKSNSSSLYAVSGYLQQQPLTAWNTSNLRRVSLAVGTNACTPEVWQFVFFKDDSRRFEVDNNIILLWSERSPVSFSCRRRAHPTHLRET